MSNQLPRAKTNQATTIMFTHNDLDGVGCGVLHKTVFGSQAETHYCGYHNVDEKIQSRLKELRAAGETPSIIISDLGIEKRTAEMVNQYAGDKVLLDHHVSNQWLSGTYGWAHIDANTCGTLLVFYHFIHDLMHTPLYRFATMVDDYDRWIHNNPDSIQLNRLLYIIGREKFEKRFFERKYPNELNSTDELLLSIEEERIDKYIDKLERTTKIRTGQDDKRFGIVFADQYQSEAAHTLIERLELDMIVLVDANNLKLSMRSKDEFDVGTIAKNLGGGGHMNAAGINFEIPDDLSKLVGSMHEAHARIIATTDTIINKVMNEHYTIETTELEAMFNGRGTK